MPRTYTETISPDDAQSLPVAQWLTEREIADCQRSRSLAHRADRTAARLAAKRLLLRELQIEPTAWEIGSDGTAPVAVGLSLPPGLSLSLSHSEGWGAASFALPEEGTVGLDLQRIRPIHPRLMTRILTDHERRQCRERFPADDPAGPLLFWALKEAAIKARRAPWGRALHEIEITLIGEDRAQIALTDTPPMSAEFSQEGGSWLARAIRAN